MKRGYDFKEKCVYSLSKVQPWANFVQVHTSMLIYCVCCEFNLILFYRKHYWKLGFPVDLVSLWVLLGGCTQ